MAVGLLRAGLVFVEAVRLGISPVRVLFPSSLPSALWTSAPIFSFVSHSLHSPLSCAFPHDDVKKPLQTVCSNQPLPLDPLPRCGGRGECCQEAGELCQTALLEALAGVWPTGGQDDEPVGDECLRGQSLSPCLLTPGRVPRTDREGHPAAARAGGTEERAFCALQALVHGGQSP